MVSNQISYSGLFFILRVSPFSDLGSVPGALASEDRGKNQIPYSCSVVISFPDYLCSSEHSSRQCANAQALPRIYDGRNARDQGRRLKPLLQPKAS